MVGLYRLLLEDCPADPLDESSADWSTSCSQTVRWNLDMTWDAVGRLVDVIKTEGGAETIHLQNVFDSSNTRSLRLELSPSGLDDEATLYVSPGYEVRVADVDPINRTYSGGEETKFVFDGPQRLARVVEPNTLGSTWPDAPSEGYVLYTLTNHLGSAAVTIHANPALGQGSIVAAQTQLPYGAEDAAVESTTHGGWRPDYEFTGKEEDPDVGLMDFGARFYAPGLGRWVSADPLFLQWSPESTEEGEISYQYVDTSQTNLYQYCLNNPLRNVDPNGSSVWDFLQGLNDGANDSAGDTVNCLSNTWNLLYSVAETLLAIGNSSTWRQALAAGEANPIVQSLVGIAQQAFSDGRPNYRQMPAFVAGAVALTRAISRNETPDDSRMHYMAGRMAGEVVYFGVEAYITAGAGTALRSSSVLSRLSEIARNGRRSHNRQEVSGVLGRIWRYPQVIDPRTGRHIPMPTGELRRVPRSQRVSWGMNERSAFIAEWYERGYATPRGGWRQYDIHHIRPREFGGTNEFWNLVPVERATHASQFNRFWREFVE